jgi:hypothetical protein
VKDEFGSTSIDGLHEIPKRLMRCNNIVEAPISKVVLQSFEAVGGVKFFIDSKSSLGVSDSLFLFGLEEDFEDIDHAASIENGTVLREEFPGDGW